jgi:hypothetical protein
LSKLFAKGILSLIKARSWQCYHVKRRSVTRLGFDSLVYEENR